MAPFLQPHAEGVFLKIKLQPRASKNEIGLAVGDELKIKVTAPPVDAAANEALLRLLAEKFDCRRGSIELVRGHTSRHKLVFIRGASVQSIEQKLDSARL